MHEERDSADSLDRSQGKMPKPLALFTPATPLDMATVAMGALALEDGVE